MCLASSERLYCWREELYAPVLYLPKSSVEAPCVDDIVESLLCEGGDVELGARTSKQISLFAFDSLTLTLSLFYIVPCIDSYCHIILLCLVVIVCVPHLCQPRELHIAAQLLLRGIKRS